MCVSLIILYDTVNVILQETVCTEEQMQSYTSFILYRKLASGVQKYIKAVYTEYTDSTFTTVKSKPPWAGEYDFNYFYLFAI